MITACFYCGIDSTDLIIFLGITIGCGVLSLIAFIVAGIANGHLEDEVRLARTPLDVEGDDFIADEDIP